MPGVSLVEQGTLPPEVVGATMGEERGCPLFYLGEEMHYPPKYLFPRRWHGQPSYHDTGEVNTKIANEGCERFTTDLIDKFNRWTRILTLRLVTLLQQ